MEAIKLPLIVLLALIAGFLLTTLADHYLSPLLPYDDSVGRISLLETKVAILDSQIEFLTDKIADLERKIVDVDITAYSPTVDQCDQKPFITSSGIRVRKGIIAISNDLEEEYGLEFGDKIEIIGLGVFEFQDRMHSKWQKRVDIFFWGRRDAIEFGKKKGKIKIF